MKMRLIVLALILVPTAGVFAVDQPGSFQIVDKVGNYHLSIFEHDGAMTGKWTLEADAGGQEVELVLNLTQQDSAFSGTVSTEMGDGTVVDGEVTDSKFTATIKIEIQGAAMELDFKGNLDGEEMSGTIEGPGIPVVSFTGTREKAEKTDGN